MCVIIDPICGNLLNFFIYMHVFLKNKIKSMILPSLFLFSSYSLVVVIFYFWYVIIIIMKKLKIKIVLIVRLILFYTDGQSFVASRSDPTHEGVKTTDITDNRHVSNPNRVR